MGTEVAMPMCYFFLWVEFFGHPPFGLLEALLEGSNVVVDSMRVLASVSATSSRTPGAWFATIEDVLLQILKLH